MRIIVKLLLVVAAILVFYAYVQIRVYTMLQHFERGTVRVEAVVADVQAVRGNTYRKFHYTYHADGRRYEGSSNSRKQQFHRLKVGDQIPIEYAADKPSFSRPLLLPEDSINNFTK